MLKKLQGLLDTNGFNNLPVTPKGKPAEPLSNVFKRDLALLVLLSYILLIFNPVTPIIADFMEHTFWEKQHLLTIHQVNGKYHVHFELMRAAHNADNKSSGNLKSGGDDYVHVVFSLKYNFLNNNHFTKRSYPLYTHLYQPGLQMDIDSPPPWVKTPIA